MARALKGDDMGKRIEAKDQRCQERQELQDIIPLAAPFVFYIDPTNACNFKCSFCPTSDKELLKQVGRPTGFMELELFTKIVDDIRAFNHPISLVNLYKDGEPLLNKNFPEMVRIVKDAKITDRIWTKSNGALLTPELSRQIVDAGLTWIGISVEAVSKEGYKDIAKVDIDYEQLKENIKYLYEYSGNKCIVHTKIINYGQPKEEIERFYQEFESISHTCAVENLMGWSYSNIKDFTLGTKSDTYDGLPFTQKDVCPYPFYVMAINSNGQVSLCGNDWSHNTAVGDVNKQTLQEIWNGETLFNFRKMLLEGRRYENKACGECYYLKIVPDNIDPYREQILNNLMIQRNE